MRHLAMDRVLYKGVGHGGDGWVKDERDKKEESKETNNGSGAEDQGSVILDVLQS